MNAGRDYARAKRQAQANADRTGTPRYLSLYNGIWWIDREQSVIGDRERIDPEPTTSTYATPSDRTKG